MRETGKGNFGIIVDVAGSPRHIIWYGSKSARTAALLRMRRGTKIVPVDIIDREDKK